MTSKGEKKKRLRLIRKGAPLPGSPSFKFDSSYTSNKEADKRVNEILSSETKEVAAVKELIIPN